MKLNNGPRNEVHVYTPMVFDGQQGVFLYQEAYNRLVSEANAERSYQEDEISELRNEVQNLRNILDEALTTTRDLAYDLSNA